MKAEMFPEETHPTEQPEQWVDVIGDRVMVRVIELKKGVIVPQHVHADDHFTMIMDGAVRMWIDGNLAGDFTAPRAILIRKGVEHHFQGLNDRSIMVCNHFTDGKGEPAILSEGTFKEN